MEKSVQAYLGSLKLGEVQQFKNLSMVPVVSDYDDGLEYITLGEALGAGSIETREVKLTEIRYQLCAQGIQVDLTHQLQQVCVFLAQNGLVPILKQVPASPVPQVEADGIARQKPPHDIGNGNKTGAEQKMKVIGHQGPCKTAGLTVAQNTAKPIQKMIAVAVVLENLPAFDSSDDDVMQWSWSI